MRFPEIFNRWPEPNAPRPIATIGKEMHGRSTCVSARRRSHGQTHGNGTHYGVVSDFEYPP